MNCLLEGAIITMKDGKTSSLEQIYIRGGQIRTVIFPDMMKYAPMFKITSNSKTKRGSLVGLSGMRRAMQMRVRGSLNTIRAKIPTTNPRGVPVRGI